MLEKTLLQLYSIEHFKLLKERYILMLKVAIAGFRHDHILELVNKTNAHPQLELVGCAESDAEARAKTIERGIAVEWSDPMEMIEKLPCDIVGIGDVYAKRGAIAIAALKAGKHVIADKPLCTSLTELAEIRKLSSEKGLSVGLMLPLWSSPNAQTARRLIAEGKLGEVQSVVFTGQHPLNYGTRADWYWQENMQGGTINDIAPHGVDLVEYITNMKFADTVCSRCWNDHFPEVPHFKNGAQFMATLENGAGVMADVSYFACHFAHPTYWRFTVWGTEGWLEFAQSVPGVKFTDKTTPTQMIYPEDSNTDYLKEFLAEIAGDVPAYFNTNHILDMTETTLKIQAAAN